VPFLGLAASLCLIAGTVVAIAPPAGAAPVWSIGTSPSPAGPPDGFLAAVACPSATSCLAVGYSGHSTLVERWNGTSWSISASPKPAGAASAALHGVSCPSTTSCFAVGNYTASTQKTLVEHWNGTAWAIVTSPNPTGASSAALNGVSCLSDTNCHAVGNYSASSTGKTLVEHWNGTAWSVIVSPNPTSANFAVLSGVACPSTTSCFAVGTSFVNSANNTLVEHWNGTAWSVVTNPTSFGVLSGVACPSTTSCFAVGTTGSGPNTLVEHWNGTSWSNMTSPNPTGFVYAILTGVSCPSTTSCYAVDRYSSGSAVKTLIEHWNGTSWSIMTSPNPIGSDIPTLQAVACPSTTNCNAVGNHYGVGNATLVEHWNGTAWSLAASPPGTSQSALGQVACLSTTNCFAVGHYVSPSSGGKTLVEHWDGTSWSIVATPNPSGATDASLDGIACTSTTSCFAVGNSTAANFTSKTLIEQWNGTSWSIVSLNPTGIMYGGLGGVSCPSPSSCFAVGQYSTGSDFKTLVERWNGTSWSIMASPNPSGAFSLGLNGVSCPSTTNCNAVGNSSQQPLIEHWNGTSWTIATSPAPAGPANLTGVACATTTSCEAVGTYAPSGQRTLVEHFNGTTWSIATTPNPAGATNAVLGGVTCVSATNCFAVGNSSTSSGSKTLVEQWSGTAWSIVTSPNPAAATDSTLTGVACPGAANCYAVGTYHGNASDRTLIERYA
jgi:hypothetical protein